MLYDIKISKLSEEIHQILIDLTKRGDFSGICFGESFTGGLICSSLIDNPGSSNYILGGITFYNSEIKKAIGISSDIVENNIISSECAREAALMIFKKFVSWGMDPEFSLSSIGLAENNESGGGKIFLSIYTRKGIFKDKQFFFDFDTDLKTARNRIRKIGTIKALEMILEEIREKNKK